MKSHRAESDPGRARGLPVSARKVGHLREAVGRGKTAGGGPHGKRRRRLAPYAVSAPFRAARNPTRLEQHASTRALSPPIHQSSLSQALALRHLDIARGLAHAVFAAQARTREHRERVRARLQRGDELRLHVAEVRVGDRVLRLDARGGDHPGGKCTAIAY